MNKCQINVVSIENFLHEQVSNKQASNKCALKWVVPVWKGSNEMVSTVSIQTFTAIYSIFKRPSYSTWSLQKNKKYWNELVCNISCLLKYARGVVTVLNKTTNTYLNTVLGACPASLFWNIKTSNFVNIKLLLQCTCLKIKYLLKRCGLHIFLTQML